MSPADLMRLARAAERAGEAEMAARYRASAALGKLARAASPSYSGREGGKREAYVRGHAIAPEKKTAAQRKGGNSAVTYRARVSGKVSPRPRLTDAQLASAVRREAFSRLGLPFLATSGQRLSAKTRARLAQTIARLQYENWTPDSRREYRERIHAARAFTK